MKINELIAEQTDLDEGIGSFLGKAAGHVAGAAGAAWRDAKQGYKDAKSVWDPKDPAGTYNNDPAAVADPNAPAPQQTPAPAPQQTPAPQGGNAPAPAPQQAPAADPQGGNAPAPQQAPAADPSAIGSIMQAVDKLDPESKKQLAGELEKNINTPAQWPAGLPKFNSVTGQKFASPEEAEQVINSPEFKQQAADIAAGKDPAAPEATPPAPEATPPAPTNTTTPAPTALAPTTPPADGKMSAAQQAALKAKLQGQRQAGKTTATQTGSGFKNYVGGSGERMTGVDASGAPVYQKIQRESVEFRSNFLGMMI